MLIERILILFTIWFFFVLSQLNSLATGLLIPNKVTINIVLLSKTRDSVKSFRFIVYDSLPRALDGKGCSATTTVVLLQMKKVPLKPHDIFHTHA